MIEFLSRNAKLIKSEPLVFISFAIIIIPITFFITRLFYLERISTIQERLITNDKYWDGERKILEQRLQAKDDQLNDYRQRLHLIEAKTISISQSINRELQTKAFNLISQMRDYLNQAHQHQIESSALRDKKIEQAKTKEEKDKIWHEHSLIYKPSLNIEYSERFKSDVIIIRDEILSRLPKDKNRKPSKSLMYEYPTNLLGLQDVIDDLEKLAKSLPLS